MTAIARILAAAAFVPAVFGAAALPAQAAIVAYDVDITIDQLPPGSHFKIGDHHNARILFDTAAVDADGKAPLLHLQHMKTLAPAHPDAVQMPMGNGFVLTKASPMAFHYGALPPSGMSTQFDEKTRRITIRNATTGELTLGGPYVIAAAPVRGPDIDAAVRPVQGAPVTLDVDMVVEAAGPGSMMAAGSHDRVRISYDPAAVDAKGRVRLTSFQHIMKGKVLPSMPVDAAWLNTGAQPSIDFAASVVHGKAITVLLDGSTRSFAIVSRPDYAVVSRGTYTVGPPAAP